jgi:hypothetical protein
VMQMIDVLGEEASFPADYPDTVGYHEYCREECNRLQSKEMVKPPGKRVNYKKIGVDSPFLIDWSAAIRSGDALAMVEGHGGEEEEDYSISSAVSKGEEGQDIHGDDMDEEVEEGEQCSMCVVRGSFYIDGLLPPSPFPTLQLPAFLEVSIALKGKGSITDRSMVTTTCHTPIAPHYLSTLAAR